MYLKRFGKCKNGVGSLVPDIQKVFKKCRVVMKCELGSSPEMGNWAVEKSYKSPDESSPQRQPVAFSQHPPACYLLSLLTLLNPRLRLANL